MNVRDYLGEIFEKIAEPNLLNEIHKEFIEECLVDDIVGCLVLLIAWEKGADNFYRRVMSRLIELRVNGAKKSP